MFPLLKLPLLCIKGISDLWEPDELYNFSLLSKRAKGISKTKKWNHSIELDVTERSLFLRDDYVSESDWIFKQNRFQISQNRDPPIDTDISPFIQAIQHFLDVFNCHFGFIYFNLKPPLTNDHLIEIINWLNNTKTKIEAIWVTPESWPMFDIFMNRFQRNINYLTNVQGIEEYDGVIHNRLNFEIEDEFYSDNCTWFNIEFLLSMDTENITAYKTNLSAEDLNIFLKSWQEGKTNQKVTEMLLTTCSENDLKEIVKGCGGELMDPRTTKLKFRQLIVHDYEDIWICGGIHIKGSNGRFAVIGGYLHHEEEEEILEDEIEEYLEHLNIWNSENERLCQETYYVYIT